MDVALYSESQRKGGVFMNTEEIRGIGGKVGGKVGELVFEKDY
mgnify:CR=1 FL=1